MAATVASQISPQQVFSLAKQVLELFLKIQDLFKKNQSKATPPLIVRGDNNTVTIINGDVKLTTQRQTAETMARSYSELRKISSQFDKDAVEEMELRGGTEESLRISAANQEKLLTFPKLLRDEIISLLREQQATGPIVERAVLEQREKRGEELEAVGDIISFNKKDRIGIISLLRSVELPPGEYRFRIQSRDNSINFITAMLQSRVRIRFSVESIRKKTSLNITWIEKELGAGA